MIKLSITFDPSLLGYTDAQSAIAGIQDVISYGYFYYFYVLEEPLDDFEFEVSEYEPLVGECS